MEPTDSAGGSDPPSASETTPVRSNAQTPPVAAEGDLESEPTVIDFKLEPDQRNWLLDNHYATYLLHKCPRGTRSRPTAKSFSHGLFNEFVEEFFSGWSNSKRDLYRPKVQYVIYNLFNNHYANDDEAQKEREISKAKTEGKKRVNPENLWSSNNRPAVDKAMEKHLKENPKASRKPGTRRHVICEEFKKLPDDERLLWTSKAAETRAVQKAEGPLTGEARIAYSAEWLSRLNRLILEGRRNIGLSFSSIVGWEVEGENGGSAYQMDTYVSTDIKDYKESQEFADSVEQFSKWFRDFKGATVSGCDPAISVIPDLSNGSLPKMPELPEVPTLNLVRNLNRQFVNAEYSYMGGVGLAPWTKMEQDYLKGEFNNWVEPGRWLKGVDFKDPSGMNLGDSLQVYWHFRKRQDGSPKEEIFQVCRVFAGTTPPASTSGASRQTLVDHCGRKVWMIEYDRYHEKSPSTRPVAYSELSWKFFYFTRNRGGLDHWNGLPSVEDNPVIELFTSEAIAFVQKLLEPVEPELCSRVTGLMNTVNQIELHAPFTTRDGIWGLSGDSATLPKLIPSSKPDDIVSTLTSSLLAFWLDELYFMSEYVAKSKGYGGNASASHLEYWFESVRDSSLIHGPSKTVQGGGCGIVWVVFALIKSLLNAAVTALDLVAPTPAPANVKLERFGKGEYYKLIDLLETWEQLSNTSLAELSKTSSERIHVAEPEAASTPDPEPLPQPQSPGPSKKKSAAKKKSAGKKTRPSKGKSTSFGDLNKSESEESSDSDVGAQEKEVQKRNPTKRPFVLNKALFEAPPTPTDPGTRQNVFGLFGVQPEVPEFSGTLQELIDRSNESLLESQSALDAWKSLELDYGNPYPLAAMQHAGKLAEPSHPARQPLIEVVLLHRFNFNRAMSYWPKVKICHQDLLLVSRKSAVLQKSIKERLSAENRATPKLGKKQLKELRAKLEAKFWVCWSVFEGMKEAERQATRYANKLQDSWNEDVLKMGTNDLVQLCHGLAAWRDDLYQAMRDLRNIYIQEWNESDHYKYEEVPKHMVYLFGSPGTTLVGGTAHTLLSRHPPGVPVGSPEPKEREAPTHLDTNVAEVVPPDASEKGGPEGNSSRTSDQVLGRTDTEVVPSNPSVEDTSTGRAERTTAEATLPVDQNASKGETPQSAPTAAPEQPDAESEAMRDPTSNADRDPLLDSNTATPGHAHPPVDTAGDGPTGSDVDSVPRATERNNVDMGLNDGSCAGTGQIEGGGEPNAVVDDKRKGDPRGQALPDESSEATNDRSTRSKSRRDGNASGAVENAGGKDGKGGKGGKDSNKGQRNTRKRKADALEDEVAFDEDDGLQSHLQSPGAGASKDPKLAGEASGKKPVRKRGRGRGGRR